MQLKEEKNDFFPLNRALCLSAKDQDSTESKVDELLNYVMSLVQKQKEEVCICFNFVLCYVFSTAPYRCY